MTFRLTRYDLLAFLVIGIANIIFDRFSGFFAFLIVMLCGIVVGDLLRAKDGAS